MRIAPKPKQWQQVHLDELLSAPIKKDPEKPALFSGMTLSDGRIIPGRQSFIQDNGAFFTIGIVQAAGRSLVIDVKKELGGKSDLGRQKLIPGHPFTMPNGIEFYQILKTGLTIQDLGGEYRQEAADFIRTIRSLWDEAAYLEVNTKVTIIDGKRAVASHKTDGCPDYEIFGESIGPTNEPLPSPIPQFTSICEMLFGIADVHKISQLWIGYNLYCPKVYQNTQWTPQSEAQEFYPLLGTEAILHLPSKPQVTGFLQIRRHQLQR